MKEIAQSQWRYLDHAKKDAARHHRKPAIVLDADDTTLWTYDMEDNAMHFVFDPKVQDVEWVQKQRFPATPSMVDFVNKAKQKGFAIFGLTGRSDTQEEATLGNLAKVGYTPFNADNFYTKWSGTNPQPSYITCAAPKCTTVEYKAGTRRHIEKDLGYDIVLNVGDQWSDLQGGYADKVLKLPNPTYNLPSPDLDGTPADRRVLAPHALHHEAGRHERCHRGRRGHPQHRHREVDDPHLLRRGHHRHRRTRPTRPTSARWRS